MSEVLRPILFSMPVILICVGMLFVISVGKSNRGRLMADHNANVDANGKFHTKREKSTPNRRDIHTGRMFRYNVGAGHSKKMSKRRAG